MWKFSVHKISTSGNYNILRCDQIYKTYLKTGSKNSDYLKFQEATSIVSDRISRRAEESQNHIALKLNDPMTTTKTYWSVLKTFYNAKKVPIIPSLLINDNLISY